MKQSGVLKQNMKGKCLSTCLSLSVSLPVSVPLCLIHLCLFLSPSVSVCPSSSLCQSLSLCVSLSMSVCLFFCLSVSVQSTCLYFCLSLPLSVSVSAYFGFCLPAFLSASKCVCVPACQPVCLSPSLPLLMSLPRSGLFVAQNHSQGCSVSLSTLHILKKNVKTK